MVQKKKPGKSTSSKRKSSTSSTSKRKLGGKSLDWITDTTESETIVPEQAENNHGKSSGDSQEKKMGVIKQYSSEETEKKKDETPEVTPSISGSSSTIIKGKRVTPAKEEEAQIAEVKEEEKTGEVKESLEKDKEKTISVVKTPVEIGKTYKITEENELVLADEKEKTISDKKEDVPDDKKTPLEYEVKKEDVKIKKKISKEPSIPIPDDSSSIVKKGKKTSAKEEKIKEEETPPAAKEKIAAAAAKEEIPTSAKRKCIRCMRLSVAGESLKKGGKKFLGTIVKPFKLDKTKLKKSVGVVINTSKQPVKAISAVDRKITKSMREMVLFKEPGIDEKSIIKNIKSADSQITKSAKKLIDSILD